MQQTPLKTTLSETYKRNRYLSVDQSWVNRREQSLVENLLNRYGVSGGAVLDVPCGYGRFFPLYQRLGMTTIGLDRNLNMARLTQRDSPWVDEQRVLRGDILSLPIAAAAFDVVVCIRLLHHQFYEAERRQLFEELARVSRRYVLVSYYRFDWLHAGSCMWRWRRKGRVPTILVGTALEDLARMSGLEVLSTHRLVRYGHMQTFAMLEKRSGLTP